MKLLWGMIALAIVLISSVSVQADESCPSPTVQVTQDIKAKLDGDLSTLLKFGSIKGAGDVEKVEHDVLHQYPNADRVALQQNALSLLCNKILPSPDYSQEFKQKLVNKSITAITSPNPDAITPSTRVESGACGLAVGRDASSNSVNCGTVPTPTPPSGQSDNAPSSPLSYTANPDCVIEYKDQVWAGWKDSPVLSDLSGRHFTFPRVNLLPGDLIHLHARQCSEMDNPSTGVHAVADAVLIYQTENIVPVEKAGTIVYFLIGHPFGNIDGGPGHVETASISSRDDFRRQYSLGYKPYTWHVIVASFFSESAAKAKVVELNNKYPDLYFQEIQYNVPPKDPIWTVTLGSGVGQAAAKHLLQIATRDLGISDAYKFCWSVGRSDPDGQCAK